MRSRLGGLLDQPAGRPCKGWSVGPGTLRQSRVPSTTGRLARSWRVRPMPVAPDVGSPSMAVAVRSTALAVIDLCSPAPPKPANGSPRRGQPVGCVKALMQLAGTRVGDHRAGHADGPDRVELRQRGQSGGWVGRFQPQRPVRTMPVVVLDVVPKDLLEVASPDDQQPVQYSAPPAAPGQRGVRVDRLGGAGGWQARGYQPPGRQRPGRLARHRCSSARVLRRARHQPRVRANSALDPQLVEVVGAVEPARL